MSDLIAFRPDWLAQVQESIIEPELPICDAHHHLWDVGGHQYLIDDFYGEAHSNHGGSARHNIVSSVFVECTTSYDDAPESYLRYVGETRFVDRLAEESAQRSDISTQIAKAIIARADLDDPASLPAAIEAHEAASPKRFRGFRHAVNWDADPEIGKAHTDPKPQLLLDSSFQTGAAILAEHDLLFETVVLHTQIDDLIELATKLPSLRIVLNHMGSIVGVGRFAGQADSVFLDWSKKMAALAECPNVYVKLGGINMVRHGFDWHLRGLPPTSDELAARTSRYYQHSIHCFGPERCMFESNFPMDKISTSYPVLWNAFKKMTAHLPASDRKLLFCDTAQRLYRIE